MASKETARILAVAELSASGAMEASTLASIALARQLADELGAEWSLSVTGAVFPSQFTAAQGFGASKLYCCRMPEDASTEDLAATVCQIVREHSFGYVVASESMNSQGLLPRVAGLLDAAYIGGCIGTRRSSAGLRFLRPIYAGVAIAHCEAKAQIVVIAARPSAFASTASDQPPCPVEDMRALLAGIGAAPKRYCVKGPAGRARPSLTGARIVVAGGRALGSRFFEVLGPLADRLGAAIGATRAACDAGHAPGGLQIGQTGSIVAPELYLAVGLSGSVQHVAGMRGSKLVVAINQDPRAPIFTHADYGLIGDLWQVIPQLIANL